MMVRTFSQKLLEEMSFAAKVPIINALTDLLHPCQAIADLMTTARSEGRVEGIAPGVCGRREQCGAVAGTRSGKSRDYTSRSRCPPGYEPNADILTEARADGASTGAEIEVGATIRRKC